MSEFHARAIDTTRPSVARVYDALLGGKHHYPVDQIFLTQLLESMPLAAVVAQANRAFLARAVRFMVSRGIRQFIDLGSGIPTSPNVHEIAPGARVVYADGDDEAVVTAESIVAGMPNATVIQADIRRPETVFNNDAVTDLLDLDQPVGVLLVAVLHFVSPADDPGRIVRTYVDALQPGSHVAASHITVDDVNDEIRAAGSEATGMYENTPNPIYVRTRAEFSAMLAGLQLVKPGVSYVTDWRPEKPVDPDDPARPCQYAAVGRKPE